MQTIISNGIQEILGDYPSIPGQELSLYLGKHQTGPPTAGMIAAYHLDGNAELPILDANGQAVTADLATASGIAVNFVAHSRSIRIIGTGLGVSKRLAFSLLPVLP